MDQTKRQVFVCHASWPEARKGQKRTILKGLNHMSIHLFWGGTTRHNMGLHFLKLYETPVPICIKHRPFFWGGDEITHLGPWNGGCFPWDNCCRDSFQVVRRWYNWEAWRTNASTCAQVACDDGIMLLGGANPLRNHYVGEDLSIFCMIYCQYGYS